MWIEINKQSYDKRYSCLLKDHLSTIASIGSFTKYWKYLECNTKVDGFKGTITENYIKHVQFNKLVISKWKNSIDRK